MNKIQPIINKKVFLLFYQQHEVICHKFKNTFGKKENEQNKNA